MHDNEKQEKKTPAKKSGGLERSKAWITAEQRSLQQDL